MDNASKALIIAGAVLIAVMLVSVGVLIYNSAAQNISDAQDSMNRTQVQMLNNEWLQYCGKNKNYNSTKTLIENIDMYNTQHPEGTIELKTITKVDDLSSRASYDITPSYDAGSGLIDSITIQKSGSGS